MRIGLGPSVVQTQSEFTLGSALITGNNSTFSGAGNWAGANLGTFDVNSTIAGKMYMLGDGGNDYATLPAGNLPLTVGARYKCTLKARLNAGVSKTIRVGQITGAASNYFEITPTGTEQEFYGYFTAYASGINIGLATAQGGFNTRAFEIDDVTLQAVT